MKVWVRVIMNSSHVIGENIAFRGCSSMALHLTAGTDVAIDLENEPGVGLMDMPRLNVFELPILIVRDIVRTT